MLNWAKREVELACKKEGDLKRFYDLTGKNNVEISEEEFYKRKAGAVR